MSPWPEVEAYRNRALERHKTGRVFSYFQCVDPGCLRWTPSERPKTQPEPQVCHLHDVSAAEARKRRAPKRQKRARA